MQRRSIYSRGVFWLASKLRGFRDACFYRAAGGPERPVFLDAREVCPELQRIDAHLEEIRGELRGVLPQRMRIPRYHEIDRAQTAISARDDGDWRVFYLHLRNNAGRLSNAELCPRTVEILEGIPGVLDGFFSILDPGKAVPAHTGPSHNYLRYHTALEVPESNPPSLRVKDRYYTWKVGESLLFDDSWEHEVYNQSDGLRVVLIVDIMRPTNPLLACLNRMFLALVESGMTPADRERVDALMRLQLH